MESRLHSLGASQNSNLSRISSQLKFSGSDAGHPDCRRGVHVIVLAICT